MAWANPSPPAARLFGIPLTIDRSWYAVALFLTWSLATSYFPWQVPGLAPAAYWAMGAAASVLLFVCVLLHELGHALVARLHGIPVAGITLFIFGGVARLAGESHRPSVELKVTLAGPLVSGALALGCRWLAAHLPTATLPGLMAAGVAQYLVMINIAVLIFNLLPGFPLDGGRLLHAVLWAILHDGRRATRIASAFGIAFGYALAALGFWSLWKGRWSTGIWYVLLGMFLRNAARASFVRSRAQPVPRVGAGGT